MWLTIQHLFHCSFWKLFLLGNFRWAIFSTLKISFPSRLFFIAHCCYWCQLSVCPVAHLKVIFFFFSQMAYNILLLIFNSWYRHVPRCSFLSFLLFGIHQFLESVIWCLSLVLDKISTIISLDSTFLLCSGNLYITF